MKKKLQYWLELTWFITMCILSIPITPFIFVWAVYMQVKQDYEENHREENHRNHLD